MEGFLKLGFFSMADKITDAIGKAFPYIFTGAVIAAIWIYFLLLVPKKFKRYNSFSEYLRDVLHFRVMLSGAIAKILYIALFIIILIVGIVAMIAANFLVGLIGMLILQIVLRVAFELFMVFFSIQENAVEIADSRKALEEHAYTAEEIGMGHEDS